MAGAAKKLLCGVGPIAMLTLFALTLAGCGAKVLETAALQPPSDESKSAARKVDCSPAVANPSVAAMLAAVKNQQPGTAGASTASAPAVSPPTIQCAPQGVAGTSAVASPRVAIAAAAAVAPASSDELFLEFNGDADSLDAAAQARLGEAVKAKLLSGATGVKMFTGRGANGNLFDRALLAQRRAASVNALMPKKMILSSTFDPTLPDDTMRLEFTSNSALKR